MIALWRLAGLRKMEIFALKWADILWHQDRMNVRSSKPNTMKVRPTDLFLLNYLSEAFHAAGDEAQSGTAAVITRYSKTNTNLDKPFKKIIKKAGLVTWPKLFQNLRASCETDWLDCGLPAHVVANWMGHSVKVQNDSYAQVDDHHFEQFNEAVAKPGQFLASKATEKGRKGRHEQATPASENSVFVTRSQQVASVRISKVAETGLEPVRPIRDSGF
jgi:integrase